MLALSAVGVDGIESIERRGPLVVVRGTVEKESAGRNTKKREKAGRAPVGRSLNEVYK